jgi:homeobox domain-containing protein
LPLHCVVESVSSLQTSIHQDNRNPWKRRSNIETDSYVIIPAVTPFCEIVNTAMQRLGYSHDVANTARGKTNKLFNAVWQITSFFSNLSGQILIKNWKPLPLEKISDNPLVSVSDILGELTSVVTLKITILRSKPTQLAEIKDKLLKLLILQSHAVLRSTGCPLDEVGQPNIISINFSNTYTQYVFRRFLNSLGL